MNKNSKQSVDIFDIFGKSQKQDTRFSSRPVVNIHEFYLSGSIESSDEYIQWFDTIRHAGENDIVKIYINSYGGDVFTAIQFMRILQESPATVVMSVEGACMSAATMIFMCGDSFEVSEHSMFMYHNYSGGVMGKGGEMLDQLQHERAWSENLLRDIYSDFLTENEITAILDNKDIWMDGQEVIARMKRKIEKIESEEKRKQEAKAKKKKKASVESSDEE